MHDYGSRPRAREEGLVVQELGDETLVYDRDTDVAHCLSAIAAHVWKGCDGAHGITDLALFAATSESLVEEALGELLQKGLLVDGEPIVTDGSSVSRRHAIARIAKIGAGATALPLIISATAATPAALASGGTGGLGTVCTQNSDCSGTFDCNGVSVGPLNLTACLPANAHVALRLTGCTPDNCTGVCATITAVSVCIT
jgi:hypothetical protein